MRLSRLIALLLVFTLLVQNAFAIGFKSLDESMGSGVHGQAEYFNSNKDQRFTIRVNFVGGVQNPGIYHLPDTTNLVEALSLAGGTINDADLSKVYVKRMTATGYETTQYDLSKVVGESSSKFPPITDHDTILVETSHSYQNTFLWIAVLGALSGLVGTSYLIYQVSHH